MLFRVDAYNAFNRVNLNPPVTDLSNVNFGKVTGQYTARLFQGHLRIRFEPLFREPRVKPRTGRARKKMARSPLKRTGPEGRN